MNDAQLAAKSILYPFSNGGVVLVLGLALVPMAPYGLWVFWPLPFLFVLPIVRRSARHEPGASVMPDRGAYADLRPLLLDWLRSLVLTATVLWPLTLLGVLSIFGHDAAESRPVDWLLPALPLLGLLMLAFYPAALAALAETGSLVQALSPPGIAQASRDMGSARRLAMAFAVAGGAGVGVLGILLTIVPPGDLLARVLLVWFLFQLAHLTGWALRRSRRF